MAGYAQTRGPAEPMHNIGHAETQHVGEVLIINTGEKNAQVVGDTHIVGGDQRIAQAISDALTLDSSDIAVPRITDWVQRSLVNNGDLSGILYNDTGNQTTINAVYYSKVSISGPWISAIVLDTDPLYNWPMGDQTGDPFNVPLRITDDFNGSIWFRIEINIITGGGPDVSEDINGPYDWAYVPPPTITSIIPVVGPQIGGTTVIITGTRFQPTTTVTFDGFSASNVVVTGTTSIACLTPPHDQGAVDVMLQNIEGSVTLIGGFTYLPPPFNMLEDIMAIRNTNRNSYGTSLPTSILDRMGIISIVSQYFNEPDPMTSHESYYYNSRLNKLFVKLNTLPPVWRQIGG